MRDRIQHHKKRKQESDEVRVRDKPATVVFVVVFYPMPLHFETKAKLLKKEKIPAPRSPLFATLLPPVAHSSVTLPPVPLSSIRVIGSDAVGIPTIRAGAPFRLSPFNKSAVFRSRFLVTVNPITFSLMHSHFPLHLRLNLQKWSFDPDNSLGGPPGLRECWRSLSSRS